MTIQHYIHYAHERYADRLRIWERRVPKIAEDTRQPVIKGTFGRRLVGRLAGRLASWARDRVHLRAAPARGEQPVG